MKIKNITSAVIAAIVGFGINQAYAALVLEETIVTAQKREQSMQDVPFSVSAVTGEALKSQGVFDVLDLQNTTPSLMTPSTGSPGQGASFRIRGFGSPPFQLGIEPAVATFVDGVYRSRSGIAVSDLVDIERIEVLKGPQGTLFGKNTTAGVVHIITKRPNLQEFEGSAELSYEEYNRIRVKGMANIPLVENKVAARISGMYGDGDGWLENEGPIDDLNNLDRFNIRGQLLFTPNDNLDITVGVHYGQIDESCCTSMRLADGPFTTDNPFSPIPNDGLLSLAAQQGATVITPPDLDDLVTSINEDQTNDAEDTMLSLELNWQLSDSVKLTSITSYQDFDLATIVDGDFTGADLLIIDSEVAIEAFTQELRLSGSSESGIGGMPIDWTAGFYYTDEQIDRLRSFIWQSQVGFFFPPPFNPQPGLGVVDDLTQESTSYAAFIHGTLSLTDHLSLTAGFRYNVEDKEGSGRFEQPNNIVLTVVNPAFDADIDEDEPTGTISLQYDWTDTAMTYFTYSHGYKAGGINLAREASGLAGEASEATFDPETVDLYEIGLKTELFDQRVRLNAALFRSEYDDLQNQIFLPPLFIVRNGEGAEASGLEIDAIAAVTENLELTFGLTVLDATFDSGTDLGNGDIGGEDLPWAPNWSGSIGWNYHRPIGSSGLEVFWTGSALARDSYFANSGSLAGTEQEETEIVNTQVGIRAEDHRWSLALWCRNCTDERYSEVIFDSPVDFFPPLGAAQETYVGRPIEYGVTVSAQF